MSDLISRQDAIDALIEWYGCEPDDLEYFKKIVEKKPSAEDELESAYQEGYTYAESKYRDFLPKSGEWIEVNVKGMDYVYCSECECYYPVPIDPSWNYCPNCGADMRGKEHGEKEI